MKEGKKSEQVASLMKTYSTSATSPSYFSSILQNPIKRYPPLATLCKSLGNSMLLLALLAVLTTAVAVSTGTLPTIIAATPTSIERQASGSTSMPLTQLAIATNASAAVEVKKLTLDTCIPYCVGPLNADGTCAHIYGCGYTGGDSLENPSSSSVASYLKKPVHAVLLLLWMTAVCASA